MRMPAKTLFEEGIQLIPVVTLASSFVLTGSVDLDRAAALFVTAAMLALVITAYLALRKAVLNPILVGANLWLGLGALAFGIPVEPVAHAMAQAQAFGLYACMLVAGVALTFGSRTGYIGVRHENQRSVFRMSCVLLGATGLAAAWSIWFLDDIRVGGALPFIALNVIRRMVIRRSRAPELSRASARP